MRLKGFDYSRPGCYFVTLNVKGDECSLCNITDGHIGLTKCGEIVKACWYNLPGLFANVQIDEFVVMPDHVHGILVLTERSFSARRDLINQITTKTESTGWILMKNPKVTLGHVVRAFKVRATRLIHKAGYGAFKWQSNYFEHVIRNQNRLNTIRAYIRPNPSRWGCPTIGIGKEIFPKNHNNANFVNNLMKFDLKVFS
jgi:REP element-mobilizing transposase RayT